MSDIPSELFHNILRRVPAESLQHFRTVCKEWRRLIDDPSFIRCHADNQVSSTTLLIRNSTGIRLYSLSLDSLDYSNVGAHQVIDVIPGKADYLIGEYEMPPLPIVSCNGLIFNTYYDFNEDWVILNPLTRQLHILPRAEILSLNSHFIGHGLGYDCASDDYKVVSIDKLYDHGTTVYVTSVYSLKMESWKMIKDCPSPCCDFPMPSQDRGVYLNGTLHWISKECIIALNLETESFHKLPLPPNLGKALETRLDVLGGCLIVSLYYYKKRMDGWEMKDYYGAEKFWVKLFSFVKPDGIDAKGRLRPVAYMKSKGLFFLQHECGFFVLDIAKNSAKNVTIDGLPKRFSCQVFPGSFIPLDKNYGVEVDSHVLGWKRKRTKAGSRSKHSVTITDV